MTVVIVGAGHAGVQAAESLRVEGHAGRIVLVDRDARLPYQRPPLSKDYMREGGAPAPLPLRGADFYSDRDIELRTGVEATAVSGGERLIHLADGESLRYDDLIVATGADARRATCAGADLAGINYLRTADDAEALRSRLDGGVRRVVVVGAGFIGLEFAAVAVQRGLEVTVIDVADRPMARVLSPATSAYFAAFHASLGVRLQLGEGLAGFAGRGGSVTEVVGTSGARYSCDLVLVGLGMDLARGLLPAGGSAGGTVVDDHLRTSVPHVYAIGDHVAFPSPRSGELMRSESVQNATDMARAVARTIAGRGASYRAVPWFWSVQGAAKLQIAGTAGASPTEVERGDRSAGKFSRYLFEQGVLTSVESVNAPADHVAARKLLDGGVALSAEQVSSDGFDLKTFVRALAAP